ncbi:MAG: dihydroorotate dehydrogenase [Cereibacter sphaeroides]|uniref:Dihydroorotate dehydrogenase n=1 Tax=Cereibacter sphaeroides TaxID=1063 RepID=A0A2W5SKT2_CERSP|nr:MAG: dihydroorotate dehydrogenase [Cereibacter sphaeroides]
MQDTDLDDLFQRMQDTAPMPSARLIARIEADALAEQNSRAAPARRPAVRQGWGSFFAGFGGRGVLAGLGCATMAGVWLGLAQPAPVATLSDTLALALGMDTGGDQVDLIPTLDTFALEG